MARLPKLRLTCSTLTTKSRRKATVLKAYSSTVDEQSTRMALMGKPPGALDSWNLFPTRVDTTGQASLWIGRLPLIDVNRPRMGKDSFDGSGTGYTKSPVQRS